MLCCVVVGGVHVGVWVIDAKYVDQIEVLYRPLHTYCMHKHQHHKEEEEHVLHALIVTKKTGRILAHNRMKTNSSCVTLIPLPQFSPLFWCDTKLE